MVRKHLDEVPGFFSFNNSAWLRGGTNKILISLGKFSSDDAYWGCSPEAYADSADLFFVPRSLLWFCFTLTVWSVYWVSSKKFPSIFYIYVLSHFVIRQVVMLPLPLTTPLEAKDTSPEGSSCSQSRCEISQKIPLWVSTKCRWFILIWYSLQKVRGQF